MPTFEELLIYAEKMLKKDPARADYWAGYIRGLHRGHYGHDSGLDEEPEWQVEESESYSRGHGDGYHAGSMAGVEGRLN